MSLHKITLITIIASEEGISLMYTTILQWVTLNTTWTAYTTWFGNMNCSVSTVMPQNYLDVLDGQPPKMGIYLLSLHLWRLLKLLCTDISQIFSNMHVDFFFFKQRATEGEILEESVCYRKDV